MRSLGKEFWGGRLAQWQHLGSIPSSGFRFQLPANEHTEGSADGSNIWLSGTDVGDLDVSNKEDRVGQKVQVRDLRVELLCGMGSRKFIITCARIPQET